MLSRSLLLMLALSAAPAAAATKVRLGLGADYWVEREAALFPLHLSVGGQLGRAVEIGGRFGAFIVTPGTRVGVPVDFFLRVAFPRTPVYLEGLVGPWILFGEHDPVRAHGAVGFGVRMQGFSVGLEAGYLAPSSMLGLRLGFEL